MSDTPTTDTPAPEDEKLVHVTFHMSSGAEITLDHLEEFVTTKRGNVLEAWEATYSDKTIVRSRYINLSQVVGITQETAD